MPALVSIEMWERFSFYGMQAILVFYLYAADGLAMSKHDATAIIGAYGAFVYLTTILGGAVADRLLGPERTLLAGACTVMTGHVLLSTIHGAVGAALGLLAIGIGSGFIKSCAVTALGIVYTSEQTVSETSARRDLGFQLFYLGIQLGAMFGPIITGYLAARFSWHTGFLAAAVLMATGLSAYLWLRPGMFAQLSPAGRLALSRAGRPMGRRHAGAWGTLGATSFITLGGLGWWLRIPTSALSTTLLVAVLVSVVLLFARLWRSPHVTAAERVKLRDFLPLFLAGAVYWSVAYQNFGVFAVYADVRLNRTVFGWELPAAWIQTLNPILVLVLALPMAWFLARLGTRQPTTAAKMSLGVALSGCAFLVFVPFADAPQHSAPMLAMVGVATLIAVGELVIGPVGMAATAVYAPAAHRTTFSALYFLTFACGMAFSGRLSTYYHAGDAAAERTYFLATGLVTIALGGALWAWSRRCRTEADCPAAIS